MDTLKNLPSIEKLVENPGLASWKASLIRSVRVRIAQELVAELRATAKAGKTIPDEAGIIAALERRYRSLCSHGMQKVINATGVVLHTNLGRAPLKKSLLLAMAEALDGYCSLEFDLSKGERGSRGGHVDRLFSLLCGVPAAAVVNNNAAATFLALHTFAMGKEVIISRGELVQIGGGYRVPDILAASGATLVEVGTTNMTSIQDYERAITPNTGMILKVHQSNFFIGGHTQSPTLAELIALGKKTKVMFGVDLGSGLLHRTPWDAGEPTVEDIMRAGPDLCCFSGDKLLGGPQAGVLVGSVEVITRLRKSPLFRTLRLGKTELFLLEQTLQQYVAGGSSLTWDLLSQTEEVLHERSQRFCKRLESVVTASVIPGTSSVGGGTMPSCQIPTALIELDLEDAERVAKTMRRGQPAIVCRIENKRLLLDLRTVLVEEEPLVISGIEKAMACTS